MNLSTSHIRELEAEAIFILREVAAQFENPALMFSGGKDSVLMVYLAHKAFYPARIPFTLIHVDTGHNFPETLQYRDELVEKFGVKLVIASGQMAIDSGLVREESGIYASRNSLQTKVLLHALEEGKYDVALGGARRDEEKSRAKERIFSHRDEFGQWDPKNQRPELWNLYNGRKHFGEHFRVFPISNWTELDVWHYIQEENIALPSLYFAHERYVFERDGIFLADCDYICKRPSEKVFKEIVRCRTIGDMSCTGVWKSNASTIEEIIAEIATTRITERGGRTDDKRSETSMEDRKRVGYF